MHHMTQISHNIITTVKINNINKLTAVQCSAGKPRILVFMWMPLGTDRPGQYVLAQTHKNC